MPSDVKIRSLMQTGCDDFLLFLFVMLNSIACSNTFLDKVAVNDKFIEPYITTL